jgi:hypothetical protein
MLISQFVPWNVMIYSEKFLEKMKKNVKFLLLFLSYDLIGKNLKGLDLTINGRRI